jgi:signal transduction histidine kinase
MVVTSASGEQYNVLVWTAPILNAAGEISQVMEMATNITQIRKLQDHLTTLGFLISSISHGIKGILTGMDSGIYLLDTGLSKNNPERLEEGLDVVKLMVDRIQKLVLNILFYAKKRELKWESVDAHMFVSDIALIIGPKAEKHHVRFVQEFREPLGSMEVDTSAVRSALINILENAIEACMDDKSTTFHTVTFAARQEDNHIILDISDTGIGIDKETKGNMFNLFFSSKGQSGTGLGLFISNQIIQQHGGSISVESEPGKGSHFSIRLPKRLPEETKSIQTNPGPVKFDP